MIHGTMNIKKGMAPNQKRNPRYTGGYNLWNVSTTYSQKPEKGSYFLCKKAN